MTARNPFRGAITLARALAVLAGVGAASAGLTAAVALGYYSYARAVAGEGAADDGSVSRPLPEIRFQDANGKALTLADFRGRVVLLNLWATWCVPCRKEMPALDRLQAALGGPEFEVVALSIDRGPDAVREFYREHGIRRLALYIDLAAAVTGTLGAVGIPTTVLVDRDGRERWRRVGPAEWDAPAMVEQIRKEVVSGANSKEKS